MQFTISKNLNDGLAVKDELKIDYTIPNFTFQITATDLVLLVLLAIWVNDRMFGAKPIRFPPVTWLAVGYLGISLLSTVGAASPYLGFVELSQQIKFFIVSLFAVNCLNSKSAVRVLAIVGVIILVTLRVLHQGSIASLAQLRHSTDPEIRLVANALVVVFCGVAVNGLMDPLQEYPVLVLLWLCAGITLNLPRMAQRQETVGPSPGQRARSAVPAA